MTVPASEGRIVADVRSSSCLLAVLAAAPLFTQIPTFAAQSSSEDAAEPPECDYDINADCRTRDDEPRRQDREGAPVDLTGYWVSVVTEDWRWRMMTPPKGDIASLPLNGNGERETLKWDPDTDAGTCKPFGAPGLMRNPMRVRLSWEDDRTLRLDTDHGVQTRRFHFEAASAQSSRASLQGDSVANWQESGLKVVTTNMIPGYLRKNGVPYSADALLTEYYDRISAFGDDWLIVTTVVEDPTYLSREFITSTHFKRLADGSAWNPVPCGSG
jgi:hypothetical protein